ncbi:MAG: tetratricopeptide repeat protein [Bryobacterales bacterium]|nr:tetratricopeptide repeat protein [Bryobacterales bacterium]
MTWRACAGPKQPDARVLAGVIGLATNKLAEAEAALRKAIALDGQRAEPRLRLGQTLRRQRRFDAALKELDLVEGAPQLSSPYFVKLIQEAAAERKMILSEKP